MFHRAGLFTSIVLFVVSVAYAGAQTKLKVGYQTMTSGPSVLWVTREAGIFKKNGLEVELVYVPPVLLTQPMLAGEVSIASLSGASPIEATVNGADFVLLGSLRKDPTPNYLLTRGGLNSAERLKGRQLGISRFGTASEFLLQSILRKLGLDPEKDVSIRQLGGDQATRIAALQSGNIDGALFNMEGKVVAEELKFNVLYDARRLGIEFLSNDVVSRRGFIQKEEETLRRFIKAIVEGIRYYKTHKSESVDIMAKYMANRNRRLLEIGYNYSAEMYEPKPYPSIRGIQLALELIAHRNPKAKEAKPELFVEPRFLKQLDDSGFIAGLYR